MPQRRTETRALPSGATVPLLPKGNGHQKQNKHTATAFIAENLFETDQFDGATGVFIADDKTYRVAAYASDGAAAMIGTPKKPQANIQAHPEIALMCRQTKTDDRSLRWIVYEVNAQKLPRVNAVSWSIVELAATRYWVITGNSVAFVS